MQGPVVYGIENCDQVRKARNWLRAHSIDARFHDFRREGLDAQTLERWLGHLPWDALLNRRGQAWRKLEPQRRAQVVDKTSAVEAMLSDPTLVKRPVIEAGEHLLVGFSESAYRTAFKTQPQ